MNHAAQTADRPAGVRWGPIGLVAIGVIAILYLIRALLTPLILAAILAYLITPVVNVGERKGIPRWASISLVYLVMGGIVALGVAFLVPIVVEQMLELQRVAKSLWARLPDLALQAQTWLFETVPASQRVIGEFELDQKAISTLQDFATSGLKQAPKYLTAVLSNIVTFVSFFVMVPFIAFFLTRDGRRIRRKLVELIPNTYFETILHALSRVDHQVGLYLRGLVGQVTAIAIMATVGLTIVGLEQAVLVGIITGIANFIPYLGPIVGATVAIAVAFATGTSVLAVAIVFAVVQFIDGWITAPLIMARSVDTHPLAVFLIVWLGGTYFGILGMLLGVPLVFAVVVAIKTIRKGLGPTPDFVVPGNALVDPDTRGRD